MKGPEQYVIISSCPVSRAMLSYIPQDAFVIAADAGWKNAVSLGISPQLTLGDFDSAPPPPGLGEVMWLPVEKDDTDTHFAAREALRRGAGSVTILGGLGGARFDHAVANLATLYFLAQNGTENRMADENTEMFCMLPGRRAVAAKAGYYLSVFAYGGTAGGVTLEGVKYPLVRHTVTSGHPLGTSNEFAADTAYITLENGCLLVVLSRMDTAQEG